MLPALTLGLVIRTISAIRSLKVAVSHVTRIEGKCNSYDQRKLALHDYPLPTISSGPTISADPLFLQAPLFRLTSGLTSDKSLISNLCSLALIFAHAL